MELNLRQSVADWSFLRPGMDPARYYSRVAEIGYSAVEMAAPEHWMLARAAGLELLNIAGPGMEWGLNRREEHDRILPLLQEAIRAAGEAGIPHLIVFSGNRRGSSDAAGVESCVRGLDAVAGDAAHASVTLLLELLNTADHPDYHAASSDFVFDVVRRVGSQSVRVLYDVYHATRMGEAIQDDLARAADLIGHIHVAGATRRDVPGRDPEPDYGAVVQVARRSGYDGFWGQEFLPGPDALSELQEAFALFASFDGRS